MGPITINDGSVDPRILPDLMVFLEVVRAGSLTRAARRLNTVQSNVTARIKILESALGQPLLRRHARGVKPTAAGEAALALALRTDALMDDLRSTFGGNRRDGVVKLRLGAIETVAARHLPSVVAGFMTHRPNVDVTVQTGSSATLVKQLKEGELDVVFVSRRFEIAGLREKLAFRDELVVAVPKGIESFSALLSSDAPALKILVQRLGCSYTERLLEILAHTPERRYRLLELGTLEGIIRFVEAGIGVAVMPKAFVQSLTAHRPIRLLPLPADRRRVGTYLVAPPHADSSQVVNAFVGFVADGRKQGRAREGKGA
jgi:DNA-binding transcriptional LysR family regulator